MHLTRKNVGATVYAGKNGKGDIVHFYNYSWDMIKLQKGAAGGLIVGSNGLYGGTNVVVYCFKSDILRADSTLRGLLYGHYKTYGELILSQVAIDALLTYYSDYIIDIVPINTLKKYHDNLGIALEYYLVDKKGYTHGTKKQDFNQKIDIIGIDGARYQVKCSVGTITSKKKPARTNTIKMKGGV